VRTRGTARRARDVRGDVRDVEREPDAVLLHPRRAEDGGLQPVGVEASGRERVVGEGIEPVLHDELDEAREIAGAALAREVPREPRGQVQPRAERLVPARDAVPQRQRHVAHAREHLRELLRRVHVQAVGEAHPRARMVGVSPEHAPDAARSRPGSPRR
jgi:hypothetical protein